MTDARDPLTVLAHELRSPVAALVALADAAPDLSATVDRQRALRLAIAAGHDIERLLTDPELMSLRRELLDLAALVRAFARDDVEVVVSAAPTVEGDPTRLRQALANLVANGLRHGSRVRLEVSGTADRAFVEVIDDGPGLPAGVDPFARGTSTVGSSGVGLWLARGIAEAHGGSLDAVTLTGRGARFRLALPPSSAEG